MLIAKHTLLLNWKLTILRPNQNPNPELKNAIPVGSRFHSTNESRFLDSQFNQQNQLTKRNLTIAAMKT